MKTYQYAILRYMHDVFLGETVNIGVVIFDMQEREVDFLINRNHGRLSDFFKDFNGDGYRKMVKRLAARFEHVSLELKEDQLSLEGRAEDLPTILPLLHPYSESVFRWSEVMAGIDEDLNARLAALYREIVLSNVKEDTKRRDEGQMREAIARRLQEHHLLGKMNTDGTWIRGSNYSHRFRFSWENGVRQVLEPISFDMAQPKRIVEKANNWCGKLYNLGDSTGEFAMTGVIAKPQDQDEKVQAAFQRAKLLLRKSPHVRAVVDEDQFERFVPEIESDIEQHEREAG